MSRLDPDPDSNSGSERNNNGSTTLLFLLCFYFIFLLWTNIHLIFLRRVNSYGTMKEEESMENTEEGLSDRFSEAYIRSRCCTVP